MDTLINNNNSKENLLFLKVHLCQRQDLKEKPIFLDMASKLNVSYTRIQMI